MLSFMLAMPVNLEYIYLEKGYYWYGAFRNYLAYDTSLVST